MHTVELLEQALAVAESLGYRVRQEHLGGNGGGACEFGGQKWVFLDLAVSSAEQLERVVDDLRADPELQTAPLTPATRALFGLRKAG